MDTDNHHSEQAAGPPGERRTVHPLVAGLLEGERGSRLVQFVKGLLLPFRAAKFMAGQAALWPLVLLPALVNLGLFALAAFLVVSQADAVAGWLWGRPDGLLAAFWYVFYVFVIGLGLAFSYILVLLAGGVVASPFNDMLSERTEQLLTGSSAPSGEKASFVRMFRSVGSTAFITLLYGVLLLPILLLNLLPGFGSIAATLIGGTVGAFFVALEYTDVTFERHGYGLRRKVRMLRSCPALAGGFGAGASLLLWVPLLNFLCMPIAVVAGTALALRLAEESDR